MTLLQKMKRLSLLFLIFLLAISACKKDDKFVNATIRDESLPLAGCGWLIEINSEFYSPKNLPDEFKVGDMEVEIKYDELNSKAFCQMHPDGLDEISINEIRD